MEPISFAKVQNGCQDDVMYPSKELNAKILETAESLRSGKTGEFILLMYFMRKIIWTISGNFIGNISASV